VLCPLHPPPQNRIWREVKHWEKNLEKAELKVAQLQGRSEGQTPLGTAGWRSIRRLIMLECVAGMRLESLGGRQELQELIYQQRQGLENTEKALELITRNLSARGK
jgi:hypothetical protein